MISELLQLKKILKDMTPEMEEEAMTHNRKVKNTINVQLRQEFLTASDGKQFIDLDKFVDYEIKTSKLNVDIDDILQQLNTMFDAQTIRNQFKFVKCEWCNKIFRDKNNNGKWLLHQHQTRGKNAGKCVYAYVRSKLDIMSLEDARDLKDFIDNLEN